MVEETLLTQGLIHGPPVLDLQVKETVLGDLLYIYFFLIKLTHRIIQKWTGYNCSPLLDQINLKS